VALPTLFDASLLNLQRAAFGRLSFVSAGRFQAAFIVGESAVESSAQRRGGVGATAPDPLTSVAKGPESGPDTLTLTKTEQDKPRFWRLYCSCRIEGRLAVQADQFETIRVT